jgi:hypothetical protein
MDTTATTATGKAPEQLVGVAAEPPSSGVRCTVPDS